MPCRRSVDGEVGRPRGGGGGGARSVMVLAGVIEPGGRDETHTVPPRERVRACPSSRGAHPRARRGRRSSRPRRRMRACSGRRAGCGRGRSRLLRCRGRRGGSCRGSGRAGAWSSWRRRGGGPRRTRRGGAGESSTLCGRGRASLAWRGRLVVASVELGSEVEREGEMRTRRRRERRCSSRSLSSHGTSYGPGRLQLSPQPAPGRRRPQGARPRRRPRGRAGPALFPRRPLPRPLAHPGPACVPPFHSQSTCTGPHQLTPACARSPRPPRLARPNPRPGPHRPRPPREPRPASAVLPLQRLVHPRPPAGVLHRRPAHLPRDARRPDKASGRPAARQCVPRPLALSRVLQLVPDPLP